MKDRKISSLGFRQAFFWIALSQLISVTDAVEIGETELMNTIKEKDAQLKIIDYNIAFLMTEQAYKSDARQGLVFSYCNANWEQKNVLVMKIVNTYEKDVPVFVPPTTNLYNKNEYDDRGNLILWREVESYILFSPEKNDRIQKVKLIRIDPNGKLLSEGNTKIILHHYPIGSVGNIYEFNRLQLVMGRGYSNEIQNITSTKNISSGMMQITASKNDKHIWELTIDPNSDYLVRKAILKREGMTEPMIIITSEGTITKYGITLGKHGTYKYSGSPVVEFEVTDISQISGHNKHYEDVLSLLNSPLPRGSSIVDLRGEKPVRSMVE